jgi:hypothetical protein
VAFGFGTPIVKDAANACCRLLKIAPPLVLAVLNDAFTEIALMTVRPVCILEADFG